MNMIPKGIENRLLPLIFLFFSFLQVGSKGFEKRHGRVQT